MCRFKFIQWLFWFTDDKYILSGTPQDNLPVQYSFRDSGVMIRTGQSGTCYLNFLQERVSETSFGDSNALLRQQHKLGFANV